VCSWNAGALCQSTAHCVPSQVDGDEVSSRSSLVALADSLSFLLCSSQSRMWKCAARRQEAVSFSPESALSCLIFSLRVEDSTAKATISPCFFSTRCSAWPQRAASMRVPISGGRQEIWHSSSVWQPTRGLFPSGRIPRTRMACTFDGGSFPMSSLRARWTVCWAAVSTVKSGHSPIACRLNRFQMCLGR